MCGRYTVFTEQEILEMREIIEDINKRFDDNRMKTGEIFPTDLAPVLLPAEGGRWDAHPMAWGFPRWDNKGVIINARAETAFDKPLFRSSLMERRCIVPATGFFEWKHVEGRKNKEKYLIRLPDEPMLYMAGIYCFFKGKDGLEAPRFVILTTAANRDIEPLHDRMPVILRADERQSWLSDTDCACALLTRPGPPLVLSAVS